MISCMIIAGSLWVSASNVMFEASIVVKQPDRDVVYVEHVNGFGNYYEISMQHQLRMNSEEWLTDCILSGVTLDTNYDTGTPDIARNGLPIYDDIDRNERTGIDD